MFISFRGASEANKNNKNKTTHLMCSVCYACILVFSFHKISGDKKLMAPNVSTGSELLLESSSVMGKPWGFPQLEPA